MKISFVVPAYNEEALLPRSLGAIRAEIDRVGLKDGVDVEVIVVNNASTDRTAEVAASFPGVRVVDEPRKGLVQARWAGFEASSGALVANIDADTIIPKFWLDRVQAEFGRDSNLVALSGPYTYYGVARKVNVAVGSYYRIAFLAYLFARAMKVGSMLQGGNFVVTREAMLKLGHVNNRFSFYGEDTDLARRLSKVGKVMFTFKLPAESSGRRLAGEGVFTIGMRYTLNFFWATFAKRPFTDEWVDIRENHAGQSR
jgi:glycosyltransferase involved in cell wall biosynthesis